MGRYDYVNRKAARPAATSEAKNKVPLFLAPRCNGDTHGELLEHHATVDEVFAVELCMISCPRSLANHPRQRHFRRALFNNRGEISSIRKARQSCG